MSNHILTRAAIDLANSPQPLRAEIKRLMADYIRINGSSDVRGNQIDGCIGKANALRLSRSSDGLKICYKNDAFVFAPFFASQPINDEYIITTMDLEYIFTLEDGAVKSIMAFLCRNGTIVIEFSIRTCRGGGAGGDGLKVRLPS